RLERRDDLRFVFTPRTTLCLPVHQGCVKALGGLAVKETLGFEFKNKLVVELPANECAVKVEKGYFLGHAFPLLKVGDFFNATFNNNVTNIHNERCFNL